MIVQIIIFLTIVIVLIGGANAIIYQTLVRFLAIQTSFGRHILAIVPALLSFSFIGASILTRFSACLPTRIFYWIAGVWLGFFLYLFLGSILAWLIYLIKSTLNANWNMRWPMLVILSLVFIVTAYGVVNALLIKITHLEVTIADLPKSWDGRKAIQFSDVHLGAVYNGRRADRLAKMAKSESPDLIFFTGDYFDGSWPDLKDLGARLKNFTAPLGVYFINGNHEIYDGRSEVDAAVDKTGIHHLKDEIIEIEGVQILGLDWPDRDFGQRDLSPVLSKLDPSKPTIVLYHEPRYIEEIKKAGANLMLSGHTHRGQLFPAHLVTRLIYGPCHTGLCQDGDFTIYTSSGAGTWGPPMRVGTRSEMVVITFRKK